MPSLDSGCASGGTPVVGASEPEVERFAEGTRVSIG